MPPPRDSSSAHQFETVRKVRRYEQVAEQIRRLISEGALKPGDLLPPERDLAVRLGEGKMRRGEPAMEEDSQFHYALALAARNSVLHRVLDVLMDLLRESRARSLQVPGRLERSYAGHRRILRAIKRRDPAAAEKAVKQHLSEIEAILMRQI